MRVAECMIGILLTEYVRALGPSPEKIRCNRGDKATETIERSLRRAEFECMWSAIIDKSGL